MTARRKAGIAGAIVLACGVALWVGLGRAGGNASRVPSPAEIQELRADALSFAAANGEAAPDHGIVVSGNRRDVVAATMGGAQVDTAQDVFVVRLHGNFVGYQAPVPAGFAPPHGHYLELVYDAETKQMTDWNLSGSPQDLTRFGQPVSIGP
ncbi:MAG TPA: hypothetical protein VE596_12880 [Gaiellaceae bacterium]|jgi:hypothetical protein|nr:hypothetical protein [Gaiellaceae bacterium]